MDLQLVLFPAFPGAGVPLRPWCVDEYGPQFYGDVDDTFAPAGDGPSTPAPAEPCPKCDGSGVFYGRGSVINGIFVGNKGMCFHCRGKGHMTPADVRRTAYYFDHIYTLDR